ncbi:AraC family transcriptional regulator [Paenibacillus gansuensis]|uniref:AraC family transcriptional regulator n=1 Tax=Paenibacillus gansuensis TaxID=306542 RepID=A0ABW5PA73_9BACL
MKRQRFLNRFSKEEFMKESDTFAVSEYVVDRDWPLHWHDFFEMEFIVSGEGRQLLNGEELALTPGTLYLLTPADIHEVYGNSEHPLSLVNIKFSREWLGTELLEWVYESKGNLYSTRQDSDAEALYRECQLILRETACPDPDRGSIPIVQGALHRIIVSLLRAIRKKGQDVRSGSDVLRSQADMKRALLYIDHHYRDPITLKGAADAAGLSANYFSEKFRQTFGQSFQAYLLQLRLEFAHRLVKDSSLPITEIALASGFNTLSYFIRMFKNMYGAAPAQYRQQSISFKYRA